MRQVDLQPFADRINDILAVRVADARPPRPWLWTEEEERRDHGGRFRYDLSEYLVWAVVATAFLKALPASVDMLRRLARCRERDDPRQFQQLAEDIISELANRRDLEAVMAACRDQAMRNALQEAVGALLEEFHWGPRAKADAAKVATVLADLLATVISGTGPWRRVLRVVVSSPSDAGAEREVVSRVIDELNRGVALTNGLHLEAWLWERDARPGLHPAGPQGLIDRLARISSADVVVGILCSRLGTPVGDAESGTVHELRSAFESWRVKGRPEVMIYFSERQAIPANSEEAAQLERVHIFRNTLPKEALFWTYDSLLAFERLFREHLIRFLLGDVDHKLG